MKFSSSLVRKETAARNSTVSAPSRKTMRKTKRKRPDAALRLGEAESSESLDSISLLQALAGSPHPIDHGGDKERAPTSISQPS